jgi:cytochrome P450
VTDLAVNLPLATICEMMNIPREDYPLMFDLTNRTIGSGDPEFVPDPEDRGRATREIFAYFSKMMQERQEAGLQDDDLISVLLRARVDGEALTPEYILSYCLILIVAGNETTRNATAGGMWALLRHPDQMEMLKKDLSLLPSAVEEILRWSSPVIHFPRFATRDVEVRGQLIRAGEAVQLFYPSANRDEEVFTDPYTFDIKRSPNEHLAFGGFGEHFCLGANLARLELRTIFRELLTRLDDMELAGEPARLRSNFVGGIKHLPVRYRAKG